MEDVEEVYALLLGIVALADVFVHTLEVGDFVDVSD